MTALAGERSGALWIGTNAGGLTRLERTLTQPGGSYSPLRADPTQPGSLASNIVSVLLVDSRGALWVGSSGGLDRRAVAGGPFTNFQHDPADPTSLSDNSVYTLLEDKDGTLWVGAYAGLNHFDPATRRFTHYAVGNEKAADRSANIVRVLLLDRTGNLWIGMQNGGLSRLARPSGEITHYGSDPANLRSLSVDGVTGLAQDAQGYIWVSTDTGGLNRLDPQTGEFSRFGAAEGLADNRILALAHTPAADVMGDSGAGADGTEEEGPGLDGTGALWMSTGRGLARFDLQTQRFRSFDTRDGLPAGGFVPYAVYQSPQGELFFGSTDSVVAFDPAAIQESSSIPDAQFAEFYVDNKPMPIGDDTGLATAIFAAESISLPPDSHSFALTFAAPG